MVVSLLHLPVEIQDLIIAYLLAPSSPADLPPRRHCARFILAADKEDDDVTFERLNLLALSATCRDLRTRLVPRIFDCFVFNHSTSSASAALELSKRFGHLVKSIKFEPYCLVRAEEDLFSGSDGVGDWPKFGDAEGKLLDGTALPGVSSVTIDHTFFDRPGVGQTAVTESNAALDHRQVSLYWRLWTRALWTVLSGNPNVRRLEIREYFNQRHVSFMWKGWKALQSRIEHLTVRISKPEYTKEGEWVRRRASLLEYLSMILDSHFLAGGVNLTTLDLLGTADCILGNTLVVEPSEENDGHIDAVRIWQSRLPNLKHLRLKYVLLARSLIDWLKVQAPNLESLYMEDCYATGNCKEGTWASLFQALIDAKPSIQKFSCLPSVVEQLDPRGKIADADWSLVLAHAQRIFVYATQEHSTDRRGIPVVVPSPVVHYDLDSMIRYNGDDQDAFDKLKVIIDENARGYAGCRS